MGGVASTFDQDGVQAGPVDEVPPAGASRSGRIPQWTKVRRAGMTGWQHREAVPELAAPAPPPPP